MFTQGEGEGKFKLVIHRFIIRDSQPIMLPFRGYIYIK